LRHVCDEKAISVELIITQTNIYSLPVLGICTLALHDAFYDLPVITGANLFRATKLFYATDEANILPGIGKRWIH